MSQQKYIILRTDIGGEAPIAFNEMISHKEVAAGRTVLGAGFFSLSWDAEKCKFKCSTWGKSTTLDIGPREDDARLLEWLFNG